MRWHHYLVVGFTVMFGLAAIGVLLSDIAVTRTVEAAVPPPPDTAHPAN